MLSTF